MKIKFISTVSPPPPGFRYCPEPGKRELLFGPVAVYTGDPDTVLSVIGYHYSRMQGVIAVPDDQFSQNHLAPLLLKISVPPARISPPVSDKKELNSDKVFGFRKSKSCICKFSNYLYLGIIQ